MRTRPLCHAAIASLNIDISLFCDTMPTAATRRRLGGPKFGPTKFQTLQIVRESALSEVASACLGRRGSLVRVLAGAPSKRGPFLRVHRAATRPGAADDGILNKHLTFPAVPRSTPIRGRTCLYPDSQRRGLWRLSGRTCDRACECLPASRLHGGGGRDARARDRRQHGHLQCRECCALRPLPYTGSDKLVRVSEEGGACAQVAGAARVHAGRSSPAAHFRTGVKVRARWRGWPPTSRACIRSPVSRSQSGFAAPRFRPRCSRCSAQHRSRAVCLRLTRIGQGPIRSRSSASSCGRASSAGPPTSPVSQSSSTTASSPSSACCPPPSISRTTTARSGRR